MVVSRSAGKEDRQLEGERAAGRMTAPGSTRERPRGPKKRSPDKLALAHARSVFASHYRQFRDYRAAAKAAGVSERTGRRWRKDQTTQSTPDTVVTSGAGELTRFIGREGDLEALAARFAAGARMVSVVGPPGIGKTRLAQRFLGRWTDRAGAGLFCDVRDAADGVGLCSALGRGLELQSTEGRQLDALVTEVGHALDARGPFLVVLDNFEHLVAAAPDTLHHWLRLAPLARVLVTTRRVLCLEGEHAHELAPLALPATDEDWTSDAMALFADRASAVDPTFQKDPDTARAVAELVRRLEGIPLALELAAGQLRRAAPGELLRRLEVRPLALESRCTDADRRHATLRSAIEGSWRLLQPSERTVASQLAVFRGGFTTEAAEAVVSFEGMSPRSGTACPSVADVIGTLRESSILRVRDDGDRVSVRRWDMYASLREFAEETLAADPTETTALQVRRTRYFAAEAHRRLLLLRTKEGRETRRWLRVERANLEAALAHATGSTAAAGGDVVALGLALATSLEQSAPGLAAEVVTRTLDWLQDSTAAVSRDFRADLLLTRGRALRAIGDYDGATRDLEKAGTEDPDRQAVIAYESGILRFKVGNAADARSRLERALALAIEVDDLGLVGRVHTTLGWLLGESFADPAALEHLDTAIEYLDRSDDEHAALVARFFREMHRANFQRAPSARALERCVSEAKRLEDRWLEANALISLGFLFQDRGEHRQASAYYEQAKTRASRAGLRYTAAVARGSAATVLEESGHLEAAVDLYEEAITVFRGLGSRRAEGRFLAFLSAAHGSRGNLDGATLALGRARALLIDSNDDIFLRVLPLLEGRIELSRVRRAVVEGDVKRATGLRSSAERRSVEAKIIPKRRPRLALAATNVFVRVGLRLLEHDLAEACNTRPALTVEPDGKGFRLGDQPWVSFPRGTVVRRMLIELAHARRETPGRALNVDDLLTACWPGESLVEGSGPLRVRDLIRRLRRSGLDPVLLSSERGYFLDPRVRVEFSKGEALMVEDHGKLA